MMNEAANNQIPGMTISIARQPIFDSKKKVYAYELLYRSRFSDRAHAPDSEYATLKLIANSLLIGLKKLTHEKIALINFNRQLILGHIPLLFPRSLLGVEILETVEPEDRIIAACKKIKQQGYLLVLDDFVFKDKYWPLINLADIIKMDFVASTPKERKALVESIPSTGMDFLAEKLETQEDYEEALELGCTYFQGYFFQKPDLISRREIPGYKLNYLNILKKLHDPVLEFEDIEEIIKRDVSLTYKLLRFINSASFAFKVTIHSIGHALALLGSREVKKWLSIIVMSGIGKDKPSELMNACIIRARLCETIAMEYKLHDQPSEFFLMGMFSLVDAFLDRPMAEVLEELPLGTELKSALLGEDNAFRPVLQLVEAYEKGQWETVTRLATALKFEEESLAGLYMDAVQWSKLLD
ncbi:MAG: HDOD domain-containing protein [bacterium]|nr:HDOD domain-containing protein [bacterium]